MDWRWNYTTKLTVILEHIPAYAGILRRCSLHFAAARYGIYPDYAQARCRTLRNIRAVWHCHAL